MSFDLCFLAFTSQEQQLIFGLEIAKYLFFSSFLSHFLAYKESLSIVFIVVELCFLPEAMSHASWQWFFFVMIVSII